MPYIATRESARGFLMVEKHSGTLHYTVLYVQVSMSSKADVVSPFARFCLSNMINYATS